MGPSSPTSLNRGARKAAGLKGPSALKDMATSEQSHQDSFDAPASFSQPASTFRGQVHFQDLEDLKTGRDLGDHPKGLQATHAWASWPARFGCKSLWRKHMQTISSFFVGAVVAYLLLMAGSTNVPLRPLWSPQVPFLPQRCGPPSMQEMALTPFSHNQSRDSRGVPDHLIVAARHHEDTSWLDSYLSEIPHVVYQVDEPNKTVGAQHATIANKGNEAMAYLQFIIDYYYELPASIVFLHGHRSAWHLLDIVPIIQRLRWGSHDFAALRYKNMPGDRLDWECGSRTNHPIWRQFDCNWEGAHLRPGNMSLRQAKEVDEVSKDLWVDSLEMTQVWPQAFQAELGELPKEMKSPCCSTFMVTKGRILAHDITFYKHLRDWIIRTEMNSYRAGRMMEYTWHLIFGEPAVIDALPECSLLYCDGLA